MTRPCLVGLLTAIVVLVGSAAAAGSGPAKCASVEGIIVGYDPNASTSCSPALVNQRLFARETVKSSGGGDLTFNTSHLHKCIQYATLHVTHDILKPKRGVALKHVRGATYCLHVSGDVGSRTLRTPGAVIRLHGTMFGLESDGRNSTIKVAHGQIRAVSTFDGRVVTIRAGYKAYFPGNGPPGQPRPFKRTARDAEAFALLSVDAAPTGVDELAQGLRKAGIHLVILVAFDSATVNSERSALGRHGIKIHALLASDLQNDPNLLATTATTNNLKNVIVAAPAAQVKPLLDTVHQDDTNHELTIYFVDTTT